MTYFNTAGVCNSTSYYLVLSFNLQQDLRERSVDATARTFVPCMSVYEQAAAMLDKRNVETSKQTEFCARGVRHEPDAVYLQITNHAMINLHAKDVVPAFVVEYNAHATDYKNKLAQHLGRIHAGKQNNSDNS
jgi:hypothetical protein